MHDGDFFFRLFFQAMFCSTHVRRHQLLFVVDGLYGCLSLGDVAVVVGVVGDEQHFCQRQKCINSCCCMTFLLRLILSVASTTYPEVLVSVGTESGRRCGSPSQPSADRSPGTSPAGLKSHKLRSQTKTLAFPTFTEVLDA